MSLISSRILIVDDNQQDVELIVEALQRRLAGVAPLVVRDGAEAVRILADLPPSALPSVILLDLKMPKVDGFEVLRRVKNDPKTNSIPVVVLTSSALEADVQRAYSIGANSYVVKPMDFKSLTETVGRLGEYWLCINEWFLPA